jgi:hypothetical protein
MKSIKKTLLWQALLKFITPGPAIFRLDANRYSTRELRMYRDQVSQYLQRSPREALRQDIRNVIRHFNQAKKQIIKSLN